MGDQEAKDSGGEPGYAEALLSADRGVLLGTEDDLWERLNLRAQGGSARWRTSSPSG